MPSSTLLLYDGNGKALTVAAGGSSSRYLGKPSNDISKYTGTGFVRY